MRIPFHFLPFKHVDFKGVNLAVNKVYFLTAQSRKTIGNLQGSERPKLYFISNVMRTTSYINVWENWWSYA